MSPKTRHVYIAADDAGRHKVGFTTNPTLRRYHLARDAGRDVQLIHTEAVEDYDGAELVERFAHWELAAHHEGGEWFAVSAGQAFSALAVGKQKVAAGDAPPAKLAVVERYGLPAVMAQAVTRALRPKETAKDFIREAVEAELKRRQAAKR